MYNIQCNLSNLIIWNNTNHKSFKINVKMEPNKINILSNLWEKFHYNLYLFNEFFAHSGLIIAVVSTIK